MTINLLLRALVYAEREIGNIGPLVIGRKFTRGSPKWKARRRFFRRISLSKKLQAAIIEKSLAMRVVRSILRDCIVNIEWKPK